MTMPSGMTTDNPWGDISAPSLADSVNARRVDANLQWNFFWARAADNAILLTMSLSGESVPSTPLPRLKDIEVSISPPDDRGSRILAFKLHDNSQQDLFHTLCQDIISAAGTSATEGEACSIALMRTWRWHHLLRGGGSELSAEDQRGLLGELQVLEQLLWPELGASGAVEAWKGPLDAPKDFEIGRVAIEVKSRRGGATSSIAITSEDQLDESGVDFLFLYVCEMDRALADNRQGFTVTEAVERVQGRLFDEDARVSHQFETLVTAAGFDHNHDYSHSRWIEGASHIYHVTGDFPRITGYELRQGISRVRYSVSLSDCQAFEITESQLYQALA